jgi:tetratricopeptide (TPR) repeat protein
MQNWKTLAEAAERGDAGLATDARDKILYLQRTVLYARHKGVVHPRAHVPLVSYDNVGNIMFWRMAPKLDEALVADLDDLLHEVRPEIRSDAKVGSAISVHMALTWVGSVASQVKDGKRFEDLRDGLGYTLPGPYEVAPAVDAMVDVFIAALPETDFGRVAFAAGPTNSRPAPEAEGVAGPTSPADPVLVEHLFEQAVSAGNAGRHEDAADGFGRVLGLDPENGGAHLNLAKALIQLGDPESAIEHLQAATAIEVPKADARPDLIQAHFNAAAAAFNRGDSPVAIANYRRVWRTGPRRRRGAPASSGGPGARQPD